VPPLDRSSIEPTRVDVRSYEQGAALMEARVFKR
jgi:hypothetical protein